MHDSMHTFKQFQIKMADIDNWIDIAKQCKYLPENDLKVIFVGRYVILVSLWVSRVTLKSFLVILMAETLRLCVSVVTRRIERAASFNAGDSLWRYSRTGTNSFWLNVINICYLSCP